jgi:hypothetical protein
MSIVGIIAVRSLANSIQLRSHASSFLIHIQIASERLTVRSLQSGQSDASFVRRTLQSVHGTSGRCCSMKCWCKARTASFARSSDTIQVMRNDEVAVPAGTMPTAFNVAAPMRTLS